MTQVIQDSYIRENKYVIFVFFQIRLNAKNITMKNILISRAEFDGSPYAEVYQLCVCGTNGKLFLSPSRGNCQATISICNWNQGPGQYTCVYNIAHSIGTAAFKSPKPGKLPLCRKTTRSTTVRVLQYQVGLAYG